MGYSRVKGGEKNEKSGTRWSKDELRVVFSVFLKMDGKGIHEHNPLIHHLSEKTGRTVRSIEAQMLMFRNLSKGGDYSYGNMSKLNLEIWNDYVHS